MKKIVGIVGSGMIGTDPFDPYCWSGSAANFFNECKAQGILHRAFGVEADALTYYTRVAMNFSPNRRTWRSKFNLDVGYYNSLTESIKRSLTEEDKDNILLQIGGHYSTPEASPDSFCCCYNDGNIAQMMKSPFFNQELMPYAVKARAYERSVFDCLDKIFTMSEYLRRSFIEDFGQSEEKVVCIGVGINKPFPEKCIEKDNSKLGILFIGKDFERKGGNTLVKAFNNIKSLVRNATLYIVGPSQVPDILKTSPTGQIEYKGFLNKTVPEQRDELLRLLTECQLGVLPTRYEPFGIAVLEYMLYGMPVIATDGWAIPEIVKPRQTGELIGIDDVEQLSGVLYNYLRNPEKMHIQGQRAYNMVKEKFTWSNVVRNLNNALREI